MAFKFIKHHNMANYSFDTELACVIGVDEAIMVNNLVFWIIKNEANGRHFYNGKHWTYNSVEAFRRLFPFWTTKQLRRVMESLYSQNVIVKGNFNKNSFDRTGWYSLSDGYEYLLGNRHLSEKANGIVSKDNTIPDSKPDPSLFEENKEDSVASSDKKKGKRKVPVKKAFVPPPLQEVKDYFLLKGYSEATAIKAFDYYEAGDWHDAKGLKIIAWKQKMISSWFKDENKIQNTKEEVKVKISL